MKSALDIIYDQARSIQLLQERVNTLQSELEKVVLQLSVKNNERSLTCSCRSEKNISTGSNTNNKEEQIKFIQSQSKLEPENKAEQSIEKKQNKFLCDNSIIDNRIFGEIADSNIYEKEIENFSKENVILNPTNKDMELITPRVKKIVKLDFNNMFDADITTTSVDKSNRFYKPLGCSISGIYENNYESWKHHSNKNIVSLFNFRMTILSLVSNIIIVMKERILINLFLNYIFLSN
jgi:hypothetical protein